MDWIRKMWKSGWNRSRKGEVLNFCERFQHDRSIKIFILPEHCRFFRTYWFYYSASTMIRILEKYLGLVKEVYRWVPHTLSQEHWVCRREIARNIWGMSESTFTLQSEHTKLDPPPYVELLPWRLLKWTKPWANSINPSQSAIFPNGLRNIV